VKPVFHLAVAIGLIALLLARVDAWAQPRETKLEAASKAAAEYLQAYFRQDSDRVASLMHPSFLAESKDLFVEQYELAKETGTLGAFQDSLGLEGDLARILDLEAPDLYARLIQASYKTLSPAEKAALGDTQVLVEDARFLDTDVVRVSLSLLGPGPHGYIEQTTIIDMALHEGRWLVLGDSPEP
jgi:hypothetical protein